MLVSRLGSVTIHTSRYLLQYHMLTSMPSTDGKDEMRRKLTRHRERQRGNCDNGVTGMKHRIDSRNSDLRAGSRVCTKSQAQACATDIVCDDKSLIRIRSSSMVLRQKKTSFAAISQTKISVPAQIYIEPLMSIGP